MDRSRETDAVQAGHFVDSRDGSIVPPLQMSTTFARDDSYEPIGDYVYGRYGSPTITHLEALVARLDSGSSARVFASGMAAFAAVLESVPTGGHVVAPDVMYHGGQDWLRRLHSLDRIELTLFDSSDPGALASALRTSTTDLVWIETPVNPTWDVIDIRSAVEVAHDAGASLAVDATVTPVTTRPIELGADLTFHAATKAYNGHSDLSGGILVTAADDRRWEEICLARDLGGAVLGPFEAWLLTRGLRTLHLRVERSSANAAAIAERLSTHPGVHTVRYPGLPDDPGHEIAARQMDRGFGSVLSFQVNGGEEAARRVATSTEVFVAATSLGGVESLIEHRSAVEPEHSIVPADLLRISVGIEPVDELIADLELALG